MTSELDFLPSTDGGGGKIEANAPVEDDDGGNSLAPKMSAVNEEDELPCFLDSIMIFPFLGTRKNRAEPKLFGEKLSEHWIPWQLPAK